MRPSDDVELEELDELAPLLASDSVQTRSLDDDGKAVSLDCEHTVQGKQATALFVAENCPGGQAKQTLLVTPSLQLVL